MHTLMNQSLLRFHNFLVTCATYTIAFLVNSDIVSYLSDSIIELYYIIIMITVKMSEHNLMPLRRVR